MDESADNYNINATIDDGNCEYTVVEYSISEIINNCGESVGVSNSCDGKYDLVHRPLHNVHFMKDKSLHVG